MHTDTQVFHALKSLHSEIQANKAEAAKAHGALSAKVAGIVGELGGIKKTVGEFDQKLDRVAESSARTAGAVEILAQQRSRTPSSETRNVATAVVTETLAGQVLQERREDRRFSQKVKLALISGAIALMTSGAFLQWALSKHGAPAATSPAAPTMEHAP